MSVWTCPKCGRTFKKQNQSHYCGKAPETIDAYIVSQPEEVQPYLKRGSGGDQRGHTGSRRKDLLEYADLLEEIQYHSVCRF